MNKLPILLIVGGDSVSLEIRETAELLKHNYEKIYNVVADDSTCIFPYIRDSDLPTFLMDNNNVKYIVGFGNVKMKQKFYRIFEGTGALKENIIHPSAFIAKTSHMGCGNYIGCYSVISTQASIGDGNIINYGVTIGHNVNIGNDCMLNPGCRISGHVSIGHDCLIGANSFIFQGVSICDNCKIDALTYIRKNITTPSVCFGTPSLKKFNNVL